MAAPEDQQGAHAPRGGVSSPPEAPVPEPDRSSAEPDSSTVEGSSSARDDGSAVETDSATAETPEADNPYGYYDDGYPYEESGSAPADGAVAGTSTELVEAPQPPASAAAAGGTAPPPPSSSAPEGGDDDEDGMLRMSFLEHLEELRTRIFKMLIGIGVAFALSLTFSNQLWLVVNAPARDALIKLGINPPNLTQITPMENFNVIYIKLPVLCAIFLASPWILYQVWAFIAPGLYRRERRWAAPFVISSAGLFILGGVFAYFVAFRFGLTFLLGIGRDLYISPMVSVSEYFNLFVNVMLGVGLVFELPVLIFFLTLLRIVNPRFLVRNSRYAILAIVTLAAIITPTPDIVNLMLFATPMCLLFYVGIFASYLLVLQRENRKFPWRKVLYIVGIVMFAVGGALYIGVARYGYHFVPHWPFFVR